MSFIYIEIISKVNRLLENKLLKWHVQKTVLADSAESPHQIWTYTYCNHAWKVMWRVFHFTVLRKCTLSSSKSLCCAVSAELRAIYNTIKNNETHDWSTLEQEQIKQKADCTETYYFATSLPNREIGKSAILNLRLLRFNLIGCLLSLPQFRFLWRRQPS